MLSWLSTLLSWWARFSNTAALWAANARDWSWPLNILTPFFVSLSWVADGLFSAFFDFYLWVYALEDRLSVVFSWQAIISSLQGALSQLSTVWAWFSNWWGAVRSVIDTWWSGVFYQVQSWISVATQGLAGMLATWSDFVTNTLPTLFDISYAEDWYRSKLAGVGDLISSAFTERADLWRGWTDFRQSVSDFFTDPIEWLWTRFTDWFLGKE